MLKQKKLFEVAFNEQKTSKTYLTAGPQPFTKQIAGGKTPLTTYTNESVLLSYYPSEEPVTRCQLVWSDVKLPLQKGSPVGELHFIADGHLVRKTALLAATNIDEKFFYSLRKRSGLLAAVGFTLIAAIGFFIFRKKR